MKENIIAVDFDGTLCENKWPEIGEPNEGLIWYLKNRQALGDKIILWTCRVEDMLKAAVEWCREQGLIFNAINENLPEVVESFGTDTRKIFANVYIDDRNKSILSCREKSGLEAWAEQEVEIACKRENPNRKEGEFDYGCACFESALKAFRSLTDDGHSGMSIGFTKSILNRLIDNKPLMPIEDVEGSWSDVTDVSVSGHCGEVVNYQCKRMSSLFKYVYSDGKIVFKDVNRTIGVNMNNSEACYHSGITSSIVEDLYPITMPYMPADKPFKVYTEDFCTDPKNGDYDTVGIFYLIKPNGERVDINRFFKESENELKEIDQEEYLARKESVGATKEEV